jgi:hypothetical protein
VHFFYTTRPCCGELAVKHYAMATIALISCVLQIGVDRAQAEDGRLYAGISGLWSTQNSQDPQQDPAFPRTTVGGSAPGAALEVGGSLTQWVSLTAEVSLPLRFESLQETDYSFSFRTENRHRDIIFSGVFHLHLPSLGPARIAFVVGPAVIREDTLQRTAYQSGIPPSTQWGAYGPETSVSRWTVGLTTGADVAFDLNAHVQLVPQLRIHFVQRVSEFNASEQDSFRLGLGNTILRPAIGVRIRF